MFHSKDGFWIKQSLNSGAAETAEVPIQEFLFELKKRGTMAYPTQER